MYHCDMKKPNLAPDDDPRKLEESAAAQPPPYKFRLPAWKAETLPGVDICDRKTLYDIMEDQ